MTINILAIRLGARSVPEEIHEVRFLDHDVRIRRVTATDLDQVREWIAGNDAEVAAIALEGMAGTLKIGSRRATHKDLQAIFETPGRAPVVDGGGLRDVLEPWAVRIVSEIYPGTFSRKHVLMVPGMNHNGFAQEVRRYTNDVHYADSLIFFNLPNAIGNPSGLDRYAGRALQQLCQVSPRQLWPPPGQPRTPRNTTPFEWADILAGDMNTIRRHAPTALQGKAVVAEAASEEDIIALRERGVEQLITTMPTLSNDGVVGAANREPARLSASVMEAILAALRADADAPLSESTYLNILADMVWEPAVVNLQRETEVVNRFAFVLYPPDVGSLRKHPNFRVTRYLPDRLVEPAAAQIPPVYVGLIRGAQSPSSGQKVEGVLLTLGATPRELLRRDPSFCSRRLIKAADLAERMGARIMGSGAFSSVIGDADAAVAQRTDIGITSGFSLTLVATLEQAARAVNLMGADDLSGSAAMILGATGAVGKVSARLLAQSTGRLILVASRPEALIALKRQIQDENPEAVILISTTVDDHLEEVELIVATVPSPTPRVLDITRCKPGTVICDLARSPNIAPEDARLRPDVLVVQGALIRLPGDVEIASGFDLPPGIVQASLAETALLAMEGRFDDFTLGREVRMDQVLEIDRLFKKHQFKQVGLRSFTRYLTEEDLSQRREIADELRANPDRLEEIRRAQQSAAETGELADGSAMSDVWPAGLSGLGVATAVLGWWTRRGYGPDEDQN
ncbi:MAG: serine carboxypeptidase [Chloroflexota bacterium]|nr:serine carboxypeptidase [Chloroflexota bacterium]